MSSVEAPMTGCAWLTVYGSDGGIHAPRPCKRLAQDGTKFCRNHQKIAAEALDVTSGGACVFCGATGRQYRAGEAKVVICDTHGKAIARAIREDR